MVWYFNKVQLKHLNHFFFHFSEKSNISLDLSLGKYHVVQNRQQIHLLFRF